MVGGAGTAAGGAGVWVADGVLVGVPLVAALEGALEGDGPDEVLLDPATIAARTTMSASRAASPAASHSRRRLSMTGTYHSGELKPRAGRPQFGHKGCPRTALVSRQNNVLGARWDLIFPPSHGPASPRPLRSAVGSFTRGTGRYPSEQGRIPFGPIVAAPHRMWGTGSSCELKFIGKFKETESPSNDAMVSGASQFPGWKQPVSTDFPKE